MFRKFIASFILILTVALCAARAGADDQPYDLLIKNARIIDGTGKPAFDGDVAIRADRIVAVGKIDNRSANRTIDAAGLVVAPGFIDVHTHVDSDILRLPAAENFIRDGVTTIVCGNCGGSVTSVADYFNRIKDKGSAVNVATLYGHNTVLKEVKGDNGAKLSPEQMSRAKDLIRQAMRDGAVGFSTGLIYTPGMYSPTDEIIELAKAAAEFNGIYATHMRSEGTQILDAIDEALRVGREAKIRVEISHFKLPADVARNIGGARTTLGKVLEARAAGQDVWLDQYPYTASSTTISTLLPDWVLEKGNDEGRKILSDPEQVDRVLADMKDNYENKRKRKSLAYAVIASSRAYPEFAGRDLETAAQILKLRREGKKDPELLSASPEKLPPVSMEDQYRAVIDIWLKGGASCVFHSMNEEEVMNILKCPLVAVASDSGVRELGVGVPHPRGYGTNARVLGRYVRELKLITLEDAVRKMTSLPAMAFRFNDRGQLKPDFKADLVILDPENVADKATFENPHQYSVGMKYVITSGG
ncbi:MAG TPA: D-aminoacylase, partial [Tepidisphaeraceae bacterium]